MFSKTFSRLQTKSNMRNFHYRFRGSVDMVTSTNVTLNVFDDIDLDSHQSQLTGTLESTTVISVIGA